jgi:hypothetical protein
VRLEGDIEIAVDLAGERKQVYASGRRGDAARER